MRRLPFPVFCILIAVLGMAGYALLSRLGPSTQRGSEAPVGGPEMLSPKGWTITASALAPRASWAIDRDEGSRWDSGSPQAGKEWLEIDLGREYLLSRLVLSQAASRDDYPRSYKMLFSKGGRASFVEAAEGNVPGPCDSLTIDIPHPSPARVVRICQTGTSAEKHWSVHELYIYAYSAPGRIFASSLDARRYKDLFPLCVPLLVVIFLAFFVQRAMYATASCACAVIMLLLGYYVKEYCNYGNLALALWMWGGGALIFILRRIIQHTNSSLIRLAILAIAVASVIQGDILMRAHIKALSIPSLLFLWGAWLFGEMVPPIREKTVFKK